MYRYHAERRRSVTELLSAVNAREDHVVHPHGYFNQ